MKFDKKFDVDDIKMVRNVKDFAAKHNIKGVVKKYSKKLQSAAVITSLAIICTVSITAAKTSDVPSEGRMLAVVDVKPEASGFDTTVNKVSYEDMTGLKFESDQYAKIEVTEKNYETVLLAKDADEKNKETLQRIEESGAEIYDTRFGGQIRVSLEKGKPKISRPCGDPGYLPEAAAANGGQASIGR